MTRGVFLAAFCLVGCAHVSKQREAEIAVAKRCAAIEIFPAGMAPARSYRVLGPIGVNVDPIATHRDRSLQDSACQLGADAVIEIHDFRLEAQLGGPGFVQLEEWVDVSGVAIAWADPAAPPAKQ
jgi:hypothetical protein